MSHLVTAYAYSYDDAGNRTGVWVNGTRTVTQTFNAANQMNGFSYDSVGNLTNDGTATYGYDALNRMTIRNTTTYTYNGDGALVQDSTARYTQDLAAPLSQILETTPAQASTICMAWIALPPRWRRPYLVWLRCSRQCAPDVRQHRHAAEHR